PRRQAQKFLSAVAAHPGLRRSAIPVRLGIAVLDGILLDPIADPERLAAEFERTLQGYFPEPMQPGTSGAGRFFDLVAGLIAATQARQGDLDCLILGPDRFLEDEESAYLIEGLERKLLSVTLGAGTTVYGYLQGAGLWGDLCAASGGLSFDFPAPPSSVIDRLLARRGRGLRIRAELPPTGLLPGRHTVRMGMPDPGESGRPWAGPRSFWAGGDRGDPPDYYMMRQALDWKRRSREAEQEGNLTVALRSMENSLQEDPWNRDSYCEAGRLAAASGDLVQASGFLSRAMEHVELDERTLALYSSVYERRGMAAAALEAIRSRGGAQDRLSRLFSARLLAGLDRYEEARALYAELMASELPDDRLRGEYGRVIWALGEHAAAEEQFEAAVRKNPHDLPALVGLSEAALARGDLERAADRAERALREGPNDPDARAQTARVFRARADLPAARSALSRAVDLAPHRHDILALLADVELEAGRSEEANRLLVGALADYPDSPRIYRKLSELR
ncbi:MAG: tetratricopeptide repeat protein, partial [Acidobacteria bacterium]|nr:tetratricopeptide repeat protein [Acidobacteriota bacterium]